MNIPLIIFIGLAAVYAVCYIVFAVKTGHFRKTVSLSMLWGVGAFALLGLSAPITGVWLPLNAWTLGTSAVVGLPGVVALLLANFIFI